MGRKLKEPVPAGLVAGYLGLDCIDPSVLIEEVAPLTEAGKGALSFVKNAAWAARGSNDAIKLVSVNDAPDDTKNLIISENPRLDFARALEYLQSSVGFIWSNDPPKIHPTSTIGNNVVFGKGVIVGANSCIGHNVVIGDEVLIGQNVVIKSGAVLGEDGFGFERGIDGKAVRIPHLGGVVIEDDVEIGSLTTVCRGTLNHTVIGQGTKVDDHVHIAHNVVIGKHTFVIACAEISGGVHIGDNVWIAPSASILNQVRIESNSTVGLGAVVLKPVSSGQVVVGNPATVLRRKEGV